MGDEDGVLRLGYAAGDREFTFETRGGVRSPDQFDRAELTLLETVVDANPGRLLVVGETYGVVGVPATLVANAVTMATWRARTRDLCEANVDRNGVSAAVELVASPAAVSGSFDVAGYAPRAYCPNEVVVQRVLDTLALLEEGGELFLTAPDAAGGAAQARDLAEYVPVTDVDSPGEVPVRRIEKPADFESPTVVTDRSMTVTIGDTSLTLVSRPGLFSASGIDDGTRLLIESLDISADDHVLDLACGYGPVGAYAAAQGSEVVMSDDSRPATACAEATLAANDLAAEVITADGLRGVANREFDLVACNPPTHAGHRVLDELFGTVGDVLSVDGRLRIVHHESLDLRPHLDDRLTEVRTLATGADHEILGARYPS